MKTNFTRLSVAVGIVSIPAVSLFGSLYTFEDGLNGLVIEQFVSGSTHSLLASGGINNSQALSGSEKWAQVMTASPMLNFATLGIGTTYTSSIYFEKVGGEFDFDFDLGGFAGFHSTALVGLGIADATDTHILVDPAFQGWLGLSGSVFIDPSDNYYISLISGDNLDVVDTSAVSLNDGWYYFEVTITKTAANKLSISAALSEADDSGAVSNTVLDIAAVEFVTDLAGTSGVYSGFVGSERAGGQVYDNFMAIPEPSTYALFFGLGLMGLALARRRFRR